MTHPDSELLALGRQFENAKAQEGRFEKERARLHQVWHAALEERGVTLDDQKVRNRIARECGYDAACRAYNIMCTETIRIMNVIHRAKATTLEGFSVKLAAVAFDLCDFDIDLKPLGGADVAEIQLIRLCRQMERATAAARRAP